MERDFPFSGLTGLKKFSPALLLAIVFTAQGSDFQGATHLVPIDQEGINYNEATPENAVSRLQAKIEGGEAKLEFDEDKGYVGSLLELLEVPVSSQMLVFSKTSLQRERISPKNPRAIFFNDDVYIGWIPGAPLIEVSVADPKMGGVFYTLSQTKVERPKFVRTDQCLECHASSKSMGVPGHLVRSFETDEEGVVDLITGVSQVNHRTPFEDRWGGWFVTGTHGDQPHRGNLIGKAAHRQQERTPNFAGNLTILSNYFAVEKYPSKGSDIVGLMVLEHQTHMHNYITRLNYEATMMFQTYGHVNYLRSILEGFLKYLLFTEEAPLTGQVKGTSSFAYEFEKLGPFDRKGRSLRELDMRTRMFKYPCSYLIYSEAFDALPEPAKERVYTRLYEILSGKDQSEAFAKLTSQQRRDILEILRDTKKDLPSYWHEPLAAGK